MGNIEFFTTDDFVHKCTASGVMLPYHAAEIANEKLQKLIEESPTVYGSMIMKDSVVGVPFGEVSSQEDTHKAKLMFIEEIPKEPCKHEPNLLNQKIGGWFCKHCGVELKATWSEV